MRRPAGRRVPSGRDDREPAVRPVDQRRERQHQPTALDLETVRHDDVLDSRVPDAKPQEEVARQVNRGIRARFIQSHGHVIQRPRRGRRAVTMLGACQSVGPVTVPPDPADVPKAPDELAVQSRTLLSMYVHIDDRDLCSKRAFALIMMLFTLANLGPEGTSPVLTIPTSRPGCRPFQRPPRSDRGTYQG